MSRFQHPPQTTGNEANISAGDRAAGLTLISNTFELCALLFTRTHFLLT